MAALMTKLKALLGLLNYIATTYANFEVLSCRKHVIDTVLFVEKKPKFSAISSTM